MRKINVLSLFDGMSCGRLALKKMRIPVGEYYASEIDPYAIAVTKKNFPKTIHTGDVTKLSAFELPYIDLLIGGSPCFVAGTKVITKNGYKNIEDILVDDLVLTHLGRFKKVLKTGNEKKETTILKANGFVDTETTDNHPYYTLKDLYSEPIWKEVKNLTSSDYIGKHFEDTIHWYSVSETIKTNQIKTVYNLEVEEDNSYTANDAIVHNCQGFSFAGKQLNFSDPRSALFFEFVRILDEIREINPDVKFLLENVVMKKEYEDIISEYLGVKPILINSNLLSAQNRKRLYWTNIPVDKIKDKKIFWNSIQMENATDVMYYSEAAFHWIFKDEKRKKRYMEYTKDSKVKMQMLEASHSKGYSNQRCFGILDNGKTRYIHPEECEMLQTVPRKYTTFGDFDGVIKKISRSQRYRMLGNGWTVDVIAHILKNLKKDITLQ